MKEVSKVSVKCDGCGIYFDKLPKRIRSTNYCCRLCKDAAGRIPTVSVSCLACGTTFDVLPRRAETAKFCSDACKFLGRTKSDDQRRAEFWSYVDIRSPDECWPWNGHVRPDTGYGRFWTSKGHITAHVEAYEQTSGRIDAPRGTTGVVVRHKCDNPRCVNPGHLVPGTQAQNVQDMVDRGRSTKGQNLGEENAASKLTAKQVRAIRNDRRTQRDIGADYGISHTMVRYIKQRKAWSHIE